MTQRVTYLLITFAIICLLTFTFSQTHAQVNVKGNFSSCVINGITYRIDNVKLSINNHQKKRVILLDNDSIKIRATFCGHGQYVNRPEKRIKECWVTFETFVDGKWYKRTDHPGRHGKQMNPFNRTCWGKLYRTNNQSDPLDLNCGYRHSIPRKINPLDISIDFQIIFDI